MFKAIICNARHKAKWLCLGYRRDGVADWQCTQCDRQWATKDIIAIACAGCLRLFHAEGLDGAPRGQERCPACSFRKDYNDAMRAMGGREVPYPEPIKAVPTPRPIAGQEIGRVLRQPPEDPAQLIALDTDDKTIEDCKARFPPTGRFEGFVKPVQLTAPNPYQPGDTIKTESGAGVMTPLGQPYVPQIKLAPSDPNRGTARGAFVFTGAAKPPAHKSQPADSSYSNLPPARAILKGRAKEGSE